MKLTTEGLWPLTELTEGRQNLNYFRARTVRVGCVHDGSSEKRSGKAGRAHDRLQKPLSGDATLGFIGGRSMDSLGLQFLLKIYSPFL